MKRLLLLALLPALAFAQDAAPTYRDLIAAKRAGIAIDRSARPEPTRRVIRTTSSNAVVVVDGITNIVHFAMIPDAEIVKTNQAAAVAESAAYQSMILALAAKWSASTNGLLASGPQAAQRRTLIFQTATRDAVLHPRP